jgi:hypothetical protein
MTEMSIAEHEQRIRALELAVTDLTSRQRPSESRHARDSDDDLVSDVDHPLVPAVPPKQVKRLRANVTVIQPGARDLGLSTTQWASLNIEETDG